MFWKEIFQYFDEDGSKSIDVHELQSLIQSLDKNIFLSKSGGFELDQIVHFFINKLKPIKKITKNK